MTERMVKMSAKDIDAMMAEIKAQAKEIAELRELNLAQIKTIRTLQTKVSYYKEISEDIHGLRRTHFEQMLAYLEVRDRSEWYYGNRMQFEVRHEQLRTWLEVIIETLEGDVRVAK